MRLLTVANHVGSRGGLERTQLANCRALAQRGHQVDLVYVSAGDFLDEWKSFCRTTVPVKGLLPRRAAPLRSSAGIVRALGSGLRLRPDVVYVYRYWDLPYAVVLGRLATAPVVFHLCLPPPNEIPRWLAASLRRVTATLSVSSDTGRRWRSTGLAAETVTVVPTGVDLARYAPASPDQRHRQRAALGIPDDDVLVVYAGRIGREKGVDVLVNAFAALYERRRHAHLVVVGAPSLGADPEDSEHYATELRRLGRHVPVTFLPGRRDVVGTLQCADVCVVPSLWPEPLARSVLEPLACGVPVVASDVGGNAEVLADWLSAMLVPAGDPAALADRIEELCDWRRDQPDLGDRCRRFAVDHLSMDREVDLVEAGLLQVVSGSTRRSARARVRSPIEARSCG